MQVGQIALPLASTVFSQSFSFPLFRILHSQSQPSNHLVQIRENAREELPQPHFLEHDDLALSLVTAARNFPSRVYHNFIAKLLI